MSNTSTSGAEPQQPTYGHGKVCYLVIPANDIAVSAAFFERVFNWYIRRDNEGSIAFDDGVGQVSGTWVASVKPDPNPAISIHIMVNNAEETLDLIVASGGKVVEPIGADFPEITAKFSDPSGNVFGIYQHRG